MQSDETALEKHVAGGCELAREDWDFEKCPEGRESYCWQYEFARESPEIIRQYQDCKDHPHPGYFDEHGNWSYTITIMDGEELDDQISIELPPGFPEVPYLLTKHVPWKYDGNPGDFDDLLIGLNVMDAERAKKYTPPPAPHYFAQLYIRWEAADKTLVRGFKRWLKKRRPYPPKTRRGKSAVKGFMADLKALGAYRLMKVMSAVEAIKHTAKVRRGNPLFQKEPDWYKARKRAGAVIDRYFARG